MIYKIYSYYIIFWDHYISIDIYLKNIYYIFYNMIYMLFERKYICLLLPYISLYDLKNRVESFSHNNTGIK